MPDSIVLPTLLAHRPSLALGEGEPVIDATSSSDDRLVWENNGSAVVFAIPTPSILATAAVSCNSALSGSVDVDAGMLKSSKDSAVLPASCTPLTADVTALVVIIGPFHSGCGIRPIIPSRPVPALAQPQIPREPEIWSSFESAI